jgi:uncharacterized protein (DUF488 family)
MSKVFSIGFTKKSAKRFFTVLSDAGVKRVVDVRLNNRSQLAGFAKRDDLQFFLQSIGGMDYVHVPELAPTQEILDAYKKKKGSWEDYERAFLDLMRERRIEKTVDRELIDHGCLLCSEHEPHHCHRRLVLEYLQGKWGNLEIRHLK